MSEQEILATVRPSMFRRLFGLLMLAGLGAMLVYLALTMPPVSLWWRALMLVLGVLALWLVEKMRRATAHAVQLTRTQLRSTDGQVLAEISDVESVVRGSFSLKPSNGFTVITKTTPPAGWAPGLWWRVGKRVGIGGVTAAAQTKYMSEMLAALLAERQR